MYFHDQLPDHEKLVPCPYNQAHMVVKHRLPKHLIKCRISHSSAGTKECRFNCSHVVAIEEIHAHEETCSDRLLVEMFMTTKKTEEETNSVQDSGAYSCRQESSHADDDDDWDCSVSTKSYNPKQKCRNNNILLHVQHGTPSMRKHQREQNNERLNNLKDSA